MFSVSKTLPKFIFVSRWLQAPLYLGLIVVLAVYVYQFGLGLVHLVSDAKKLNEITIMLQALDLIDVVMIANLLIMVIIGGYENFVSRLDLDNNPDKPEWFDEMNAGTMKVKLALALIGISSIHLLRTFIDSSTQDNYVIMWQVLIHVTLLFSAVAIAFTNKLIDASHK
jgi:uncharacterized protein (TIGR00645 family)